MCSKGQLSNKGAALGIFCGRSRLTVCDPRQKVTPGRQTLLPAAALCAREMAYQPAPKRRRLHAPEEHNLGPVVPVTLIRRRDDDIGKTGAQRG